MFDVVHQNMLWYVPLDHGVCVYFPTVIPTAPLLPCKVKTNQYPKAQYPWTFPWSAWQKSCRQCISWVQKHISPVSSRGRRSFGTNVLERWWFMRKNVEQVSKDQMIEILATLKLPLKKGSLSLQFGFVIFVTQKLQRVIFVWMCVKINALSVLNWKPQSFDLDLPKEYDQSIWSQPYKKQTWSIPATTCHVFLGRFGALLSDFADVRTELGSN